MIYQKNETRQRKPNAQRQQLEARIIRAAEKAFACTGFNGTSMEVIAEAVGISKQNLIYYFPTKETLYRKVLQNTLDIWTEKMVFSEDPDALPADIIAHYIRGKLELSYENPDGSKVFAHEVINGAPILRDYLISHLKPQFEKDVELVKRWSKAGLIRDISPEHLFFTIWAATQTYADFATQIQLLMGKKKLTKNDFNEAADFLTRLVLNGIVAN
ncbi:TetR/AcrR family transcriptional regulator [Thalassolituus sp. LLYu03]|uniref:TetR/AcrR family transcriptional regulator n=1 Tax=Thalassolituus sp. LLYu03 TaxID=3421656 RepID=UPI003D2B6B98